MFLYNSDGCQGSLTFHVRRSDGGNVWILSDFKMQRLDFKRQRLDFIGF